MTSKDKQQSGSNKQGASDNARKGGQSSQDSGSKNSPSRNNESDNGRSSHAANQDDNRRGKNDR